MNTNQVYISMEQIDVCKCCGRKKDLRLDHCFDCAEAESIILDGTDMYEKGIDGNKKPVEKAMDKVRFLIKKGWTPPVDLRKSDEQK